LTPSGASLTFSPTNRQVALNGASVTSQNFTASSSANVVFFDDFNGTSLGSRGRRSIVAPLIAGGEPVQPAKRASVSGLTITATRRSPTRAVTRFGPSQQQYTSSSIQWTSLNFTYGTVEIAQVSAAEYEDVAGAVAAGSNCQAANIVNGSEAVPFMGCPARDKWAYREIDMVACTCAAGAH
jgi:hypothetical protein